LRTFCSTVRAPRANTARGRRGVRRGEQEGRHPRVDRGVQRTRSRGRSGPLGSRLRGPRSVPSRTLGPGGIGGLEGIHQPLRGSVPRPSAHHTRHGGRGGHGRGACGLWRQPPRRVSRHPADRGDGSRSGKRSSNGTASSASRGVSDRAAAFGPDRREARPGALGTPPRRGHRPVAPLEQGAGAALRRADGELVEARGRQVAGLRGVERRVRRAGRPGPPSRARSAWR
jgi:hypothetical protein